LQGFLNFLYFSGKFFMIGKSPNEKQKHLFLPNLTAFINLRHQLCVLANKIDWRQFETDFAPLYSTVGTPAKPIRLMVGLLILKQIYNLGDETVMAQWVSNPYFQYFCGEVVFQWKFPCDPSDARAFSASDRSRRSREDSGSEYFAARERSAK
jgi:IS5 family transposase